MESSKFLSILKLKPKSVIRLQKIKTNQSPERSILSLMPFCICITTDTSCKEIIYNPISAEIMRIHEGHSQPSSDCTTFDKDGKLLSPEEMPLQQAAMKGKTSIDVEFLYKWSDGEEKYIKEVE